MRAERTVLTYDPTSHRWAFRLANQLHLGPDDTGKVEVTHHILEKGVL
ncbi:hypothetical protein T261_0360 [Streptomyces lydicus]|nr:hypothetical protein T261_0360 [Streptomyces lydicus]